MESWVRYYITPPASERVFLDRAMAVALAARGRDHVNSQFTIVNIVSRLGRVATTLSAA